MLAGERGESRLAGLRLVTQHEARVGAHASRADQGSDVDGTLPAPAGRIVEKRIRVCESQLPVGREHAR